MHKTRLLTGFALGFATLYLIFGVSTIVFGLALLVVMALVLWEVLAASKLSSRPVVVLLYYLAAVVGTYAVWVGAHDLLWLSFIWVLAWLVCIFMPLDRLSWMRHPVWVLFVGLWGVSFAWVAAVKLHQIAPIWVFYAVMLITLTDIGAYFVGSHYGRRLMCERISPRKTWEGLFGGIVIGFLTGFVISLLMGLSTHVVLDLLMISFCVIPATVVGDLAQSLLKRFCDVKDSGNLLPGHGGVWDRFDSLLFAVPVFYYLLSKVVA